MKRLQRLDVFMFNLVKFGKVRLTDDKVLVMGKDCTRLIKDKDYSFEGVVLETVDNDNEKDLIRVLNDNLD